MTLLDDLWNWLTQQARHRQKSAEAELILPPENTLTDAELESRQQFLRRAKSLRSQTQGFAGPFPATEQREDRER
jgi:hypothetical protein